MNIFLTENLHAVFILVVLIFLQLLSGYFTMRMRKYAWAICVAWTLLIVFTVAAERVSFQQPAGFRMLSIILLMLFGMKVIVAVEYYKKQSKRLSFIQWLAFSAGWFGMRPGLFENLGKSSLPGGGKLIVFGISRILIGFSFIVLAFLLYNQHFGKWVFILITALMLSGLSLILHFGVLNISAGLWRIAGVDARMLFRSPLLSSSLTEFWGRRWNIAFSEMTSIALYKPLKERTGIPFAMITAFLFSGFLHEMAISVPVNSGWGLPMLYFLIHGLLMLLEKLLDKKGISIGRNKWLGRLWVIFWLLAPLPLLFHKPFLKGIIFSLIAHI